MDSLNGSVAIVTGASKGFGREIARQLAAEGARVVAAARSTDLLALLTDEIRAAGGTAVARTVDVRDPAQCAALVEWTLTEMGGVDVLVNNAGLGHWGPVESMTDAQWDETMEVNLDSIFHLCRAVIPTMRERGRGHIVNIASSFARKGVPYLAAYSASKAFVANFSESLHGEVKGYGIKVSIVAPGTGVSEFRAHQTNRPMTPNITEPDRMLTAADVASTVVWVLKASPNVSTIHAIVEPTG